MSVFRAFSFAAALGLPVLMVSCSSPAPRGLPRNLPTISVYGSPQTPPHSMSAGDYPFDASGNYVTAWAAQGDGAASGADYSRWQSSHGGSVSRRQPSPVRKVSSSSKKSSSSGRSYTVRSGDTLSAIARRHSTTVAKLKAANGLSSDMIRVGRTLKIPR